MNHRRARQQSGLLVRELRYGKSPIGPVPTQIDYGDYRDVVGIEMPFRCTFAWLGVVGFH